MNKALTAGSKRAAATAFRVSQGSQARRAMTTKASNGLAPPHHLVALDKRPLYDLYVKGSPEKGELGDCPFSHRIALTLQEKDVPYNLMLLDEQKLPEWIKEISGGAQTIPFALELDSAKWLHDSDKMYPYLDDKYPSPKLGKLEDLPQVGSELMPTRLIGYLTSKPGKDEDQKKAELLQELESINDFLEKNGPLFGGNDFNGLDASLAPKIKHTIIAVHEIKGFEVPKSLKGIWAYLDTVAQRKSWKNTYYTEKYVRDGWQLKVKMMSES